MAYDDPSAGLDPSLTIYNNPYAQQIRGYGGQTQQSGGLSGLGTLVSAIAIKKALQKKALATVAEKSGLAGALGGTGAAAGAGEAGVGAASAAGAAGEVGSAVGGAPVAAMSPALGGAIAIGAPIIAGNLIRRAFYADKPKRGFDPESELDLYKEGVSSDKAGTKTPWGFGINNFTSRSADDQKRLLQEAHDANVLGLTGWGAKDNPMSVSGQGKSIMNADRLNWQDPHIYKSYQANPFSFGSTPYKPGTAPTVDQVQSSPLLKQEQKDKIIAFLNDANKPLAAAVAKK